MKYEYLCLNVDDMFTLDKLGRVPKYITPWREDVKNTLNYYGNDGWELVHYGGSTGSMDAIYIFKRKIENTENEENQRVD